MRVIIRPRAAGKTHDLVELFSEKIQSLVGSHIIVVLNRQAKDDILYLYGRSHGIKNYHVITFDDLLDPRSMGVGGSFLYIDNADLLLEVIAGRIHSPIVAITMNGNLIGKENRLKPI